jgi:hypothetical protein
LFNQREDRLQVGGAGDLLLDVFERKKFVADQFTQFLSKLLLSFGEDPLDGHAQETEGFTRVEQHFDGDPVGEVSYES